ncbi:MAG: hypothetical protein Q9224_004442, partial [Gallowayella concinna]
LIVTAIGSTYNNIVFTRDNSPHHSRTPDTLAAKTVLVMTRTQSPWRQKIDNQSSTEENPRKSAGQKRAQPEVQDDGVDVQEQKASTSTSQSESLKPLSWSIGRG